MRYGKCCGEEIEVLTGRVVRRGRRRRVSADGPRVKVSERSWDLVWSFDEKAAVIGVPSEALANGRAGGADRHETRTRLALPVEGEWTVVWGGRTLAENYHSVNGGLAFVDRSGRSRSWGREYRGGRQAERGLLLLRPACFARRQAGVVVAADGIPDNEPGRKGTSSIPLGTMSSSITGTASSRSSRTSRRGSVLPRAGSRVGPKLLGRCGGGG